MADKIDPTSNEGQISNFLPNFYRTDANKKFLHATVEQLTQKGTVKTINGFIGRRNAKAATGNDIFVDAPTKDRQNYQLEPSLVINDTLGNNTFFRDYQDYINQINVFGGNVKNHARLNKQEFYSWDPHIDWDKFTNFQNYYWLPFGPDVVTIYGEPEGIISTFTVEVESELGNYAYIFTPNGLDRNPTIKLCRGQTYTFKINSPGNPFSIKTERVDGTLNRYEIPGISNQGVEKGTITFSVPNNAPDVLFYVSEYDVDLGGMFHIESITENTYINVETSIVGKRSYTLQNGLELSNGMKVSFIGDVHPEYYANKLFYVEGVGSAITLVNEKDLELISAYTESIAVLFDTSPFDKLPFSDATSLPSNTDYITVNRASRDHNPWSRYNRWFHKSVIEASASYNGKIAEFDQSARAVRPIIEFEANLKLYNFGTDALTDVDLVDTYTTDVFSTIEGSLGYNIDGISVTEGMRILFTAETDITVKNKIYKTEFIKVQSSSRTLEFDPSTAVNINNDTITFPTKHALSTRNAVVYNSNGNNSIEGLVSLETYYVRDIDGYSISLYRDAQLTKKVDIISTLDRGKVYTFTLENLQEIGLIIPYSVYESDIDAASNQIIFTTPHNFTSGDYVRYRAENNNSFAGPTSGESYYIQVINEFTIVFYENYNGSQFSNPVDITLPITKRPHLLATYETNRQIHLVEDDNPVENHVVLVRQGTEHQGQMFWFNGSSWAVAQQKLTTNQQPKFDVIDNNGISFGDKSTYIGSTFNGSEVFSYKVSSNNTVDSVLNFPLAYKNIANIGDIVFNFNLASDTFTFTDTTKNITQSTNVGYLSKSKSIDNTSFVNGWQVCTAENTQAAIRIYNNQTNNFNLDIFNDINDLDDLLVKVYVNGIRLEDVGNNATIVTTDVKHQVTFSIPYQTFAPSIGTTCTIDSRNNSNYEKTVKIVGSTNTTVTVEYLLDPGTYVVDETTITFENNQTVSVDSIVGSNSYLRFAIPKQTVAPTIGSYYRVVSNSFNFSGEYKVVDSSLTSITLEYPTSPGDLITNTSIKLALVNWKFVDGQYYKTLVLNSDIASTDILTIKAYAVQPINDKGYYEIPCNLQNNPLNETITNFTLGEVIDHVNSIVDNLTNFNGTYPGLNNLRDLGNITQYGTKFVQHSGPLSLPLYHITSQSNNIIRAIEKSRDDYLKFKKNFLRFAESIQLQQDDPITSVDLILAAINKDIPNTAPYYFSDMVPYGGSTKTELPVVDYRIKTYPLSSVFSLAEISTTAVLVYQTSNGITTQLLYKHDYTFNDQGFVVISALLHNDDIITIYEFQNTNGSFVPATPTKLGIWPKYDPKIFEDTSLVTPRIMIQGHDGSLVLAYGDYRDELILELEKRIYNNIKVEYDALVFDFADVLPGYNRVTDYSLEEFNQILSPSFYKWTSLIDRDFSKPLSYDHTNPMTFNYKGMSAPDGRPVPGYWRGIYRWMLDTDRPNLCPWEMLGFTDQPTWWETVYGAAPYTSDNLKLWKDLADGAICEPGKPVVRNSKFIRPFLTDNIPVDDQGNIASPIISGLASGIITLATEGDFVFGDVSPIEAAWRRGSNYPFSMLVSAMLMYPAKTFGTLLDRSRINRNRAGQLVYKDTGLFISPADIKLPSIYAAPNNQQTAGIINYVVDYILSDNLKSYKQYEYDLQNVEARISYRVGSFTSKEKFNLLLDSKTPLSSGSVFVPQEDFTLILNSSSPIKKITYSGVIITKVADGFDVKGYSQTQPYFYYYPWTQQGRIVNIGGISEGFVTWNPSSFYDAGKIVEYNKRYYRVKVSHTSSNTFDDQYYISLSTLPIVGGRDAYIRTLWDRSNPIVIPYGTKFATVQEVVDFLLGYGEWLKDQGFVFDEFNSQLGAVTNWETSTNEFLFWTTQNWSSGQDKWADWMPMKPVSYGEIVRYNGDYYRAIRDSAASTIFNEDDFVLLDGLSTIGSSVISLSPSASKITFNLPLSIVDDIRNPFYLYEILKVDGAPIEPKFINSYRNNNSVSYAPKSEDGIFGATFYLVQKEQVVVLNNSTIFNDTIYSPATGYRQERIKAFGYVGAEWSGAFDVPGFIFDQANITEWEEWTDYHLGDIVKYKQFYYSAKYFISGKESFVNNDWIKLDREPKPALLPNWTYKASQFNDFYDLDSDNFDSSQQMMAQHLIGYQPRQYLNNIIKNNVSEYKFYQGMITEKGTKNVLNKLFDVLSAEGKESLSFFEEWALRVGQYGASSAFENIEFILDEAACRSNPQGFELVNVVDSERTDFIVQIAPSDVYVKPNFYKSAPWPILSNSTDYLRTPGYVRSNEVSLMLKSLDDILFKNEWDLTKNYLINDTVNYESVNYISQTENVNSIPSETSADWLVFNINTLSNGDYIWCGFENREWNVYKFVNANLRVTDLNNDSGYVTIVFEELSQFVVGDIVGITNVTGVSGFFKVSDVSLDTVTFDSTISVPGTFTEQSSIRIYKLVESRYSSIDGLKDKPLSTARSGDLIWTDNKSATWKYEPVYTTQNLVNIYPGELLKFGKSVVINNSGTIAAVVDSHGKTTIFTKQQYTSAWIAHQEIGHPFYTIVNGMNPEQLDVIGDSIAISADNEWLAISSPKASNVCTQYVGEWDINHPLYSAGEIVTIGDKYYRALSDYKYSSSLATGFIEGNILTTEYHGIDTEIMYVGQLVTDIAGPTEIIPNTKIIALGNTVGGTRTYILNTSYESRIPEAGTATITADDPIPSANKLVWEELDYLSADSEGTNSSYENQGVVTIYKKDANDIFILVDTILNPKPNTQEAFGSSVAFGDNVLVVGANNKAYQLEYGTIVKATAHYISAGSQGYRVKLSTLEGISVGMTIRGNGFTQGQTVASIDTILQTITVSALPDDDVYGTLSFTIDGWSYSYISSTDTVVEYLPTSNDTEFADSLIVSNDNTTLLISSPDVARVYVYQKSTTSYTLLQVIEDDLTIIDPNTRFGESIAVSNTATYIAIGSKLSDVNNVDEGKVRVYKLNDTSYELYQDLKCIEPEKTGLFGTKVAFMNDSDTLVVYSQNAETYTSTIFDQGNTVFDDEQTTFAKRNENTGRIDIYDRYESYWVYSESLSNNSDIIDGYGTSIAVGVDTIIVSAVYAVDDSLHSGIVYEYSKAENTNSWQMIHQATSKIDIKKIKKAFLYNKLTNQLVSYLDVLDPTQGKIPGIADQELQFKTYYDPATYSVGDGSVRVDDGMAWTTQHVGMLWWDLRTCRFVDSYSDDIVYRNNAWNTLFHGASVDIYEWIETELLPSEWNELADTEEGLTSNISGRTLYDDSVYSVVRVYDNISQSFRNTYYYWVKNKNTIPDVVNRNISSLSVSNLIKNPRGSGYKYLVLNGVNSFSLVNAQPLLQDKNVVLSIEYWTVENTEQNIHTQWALISNDVNSKIPEKIEKKWFDSLCGKDVNDRVVPDYNLPVKLRYGIEDRPRQGMFVNRYEALKQVIEQANRVLIKYQVSEERDISLLDSYDAEPSIITGLYDIVLDTDAELRFSGVGSFKPASLTPVLLDGKIVDVIINTSGKGYGRLYEKTYDSNGDPIEWYGPDAIAMGTGYEAVIKTVLNAFGQVIDTVITSNGYGYNDNTTLSMRNYSALVHSDSQADGQWSIYTYESSTQLWSRTLTQSFDTRKYWSYVDWYAPETGYSSITAYKYTVDTLVELNNISPNIGDLIKVSTASTGNWILLEKYADTISTDWTQQYKVVGSQNGTIQFSSLLYQFLDTLYGYDGTMYDSNIFDDVASKELRIILTTIKNKIFIDTLKQEYLNLFFTGVRYALSEQSQVDWVLKTSFIKAQHNVGELKQKVTYNNDNLADFEAYVSEVKPYRTKVREYVSTYSKTDTSQLSTTDFDLPSVYNDTVNSIVKTRPISVSTLNSTIQTEDLEMAVYPWKHWYENVGFSVIELHIVDGGSGYVSEPVVKIEGAGGTGATARAFITNGRVNRIVLLTPGKDYLGAPTVVIDGGITVTGVPAKAIAIVGNSVIRTNLIKMKFDRITQTYFITQLQEVETFVGTRSRIQFPLVWGPDIRVGFSNVVIDGIQVLRDDYKLAIVKSTTKGYTSYSGTITFATAPKKDAIIEVTYIKDWSLLNAADRIQYYYDPATGELGKDLSQLMTGVDYGGVVVTGMNFEVDSGWDSVPYYSSKWDDFENSTENYIVIAEADQHSFTIPEYIDVSIGDTLTVYYSETVNDTPVRIEDVELGALRVAEIAESVEVLDGTRFIFRIITSDGSAKPKEENYDTSLSGGQDTNKQLGYQTATGLAADDIIVDGDGLVTPTTSPATEEVVPGQVVDAVAIKVFDKSSSASANIKVDSYIADGVTTEFKLSQQPNSSQAVIVKVIGNVRDNTALDEIYGDRDTDNIILTGPVVTTADIKLIDVDFTVDYRNNLIKFNQAPEAGKLISIFSIGFNGTDILDIGNFVGDGSRTNFRTDALWTTPLSMLVYVDGIPETNIEIINSGTTNRVTLKFNRPPAANALISYIIVNSAEQTYAITKNEKFTANGSLTYSLQNQVGTSMFAESNMIVLVNKQVLDGPANSYFTIANNRLNYIVEQTNIAPFSVDVDDIIVFVDNTVLTQLVDYTVDLKGITVKISKAVYKKYAGKKLVISCRKNGGYLYSETNGTPQITFSTAYDSTHIIEIISSFKHDILDIESTLVNMSANVSFTAGTIEHYNYMNVLNGRIVLDRTVINDDYVWIVKNGMLLTPSVDYKLDDDRQTVILNETPISTDAFRMMTFGSNVLGTGISYMQFKDMLNRTHFKRLSASKQTTLTRDLLNIDTTIEVADASNFDLPNPSLNKPGIIEIRGERIEYFNIEGNVLSQLRRGTLGTGTPVRHNLGAYVQDIGPNETIPYTDSVKIDQFTIDDNTTIDLPYEIVQSDTTAWFNDFGYTLLDDYNLDTTYIINDVVIFNEQYYVNIVASKGVSPENTAHWQLLSLIPSTHGQCNELEVFVGGYDISMEWEANTVYKENNIVIVGSYTYRTTSNIRTGDTFISPVSILDENNDVLLQNVEYSTVWDFFIGNIRLKKYPYMVHNINKHPESTEGDVRFDPDFSVFVDNDAQVYQIRLTNPLKNGTRVTVIKKNGTAWDTFTDIRSDRGKIAQFIKASPGIQYKDIENYKTSTIITFSSTEDHFDETDKRID